MKEIPILYSTPMVQAKLAGRKTQTRRIIKQDLSHHMVPRCPGKIEYFQDAWGCKECGSYHWDQSLKCPYGKPGDLLWGRETFRKYCPVDEHGYTHFDQEIIEYAADNPEPIQMFDADGFSVFNKNGTEKFISWKPSIFLPKKNARIWEEVVSIHVERLQDITQEDAIAEGIWLDKSVLPNAYTLYGMPHWTTAIECYRELWEGINGRGSWESNPWVWVVTSKILSTTGKPELIDYDNTARK